VVESQHARRDPAWLYRHPQARAEDLMEAFSDPSIRGIISTIGGDDSIRILPYLKPEVICSNPKVFMGYSDTTVTHLVCFKAGLCSFYGPAIMSGFAENGGMFPYMTESIRATLFQPEPVGIIEPNMGGWTVESLDWADLRNQQRKRKLNQSEPWRFIQGSGVVEGRLIGGCLEVLEWLRGTPVWPLPEQWEGAILFLETSEEAPSPTVLVRALRSFAAMGILGRLSGILFGRPGGGVPVHEFEGYESAFRTVIVEEEGLTDLPIVSRMDFGHTAPMFLLPYGVRARIDCDMQRFTILESGVTE